MELYNFLINAYWKIDSELNICYIRTVGFENVNAILEKYDKISASPDWNSNIVLVNDYEDLDGVSLRTKDLIKIADFHESIKYRLGNGKWYFITSSLLYYGIIRMYATYINFSNDPQILVYKQIESIDNELIEKFAFECRSNSRLQQQFEQYKQK